MAMMYYSKEFIGRQSETLEEVQARIDKMPTLQVLSILLHNSMNDVAYGMQAFYENGVQTENGRMHLACCRRLCKEFNIDMTDAEKDFERKAETMRIVSHTLSDGGPDA